jgi:protocadherin-16/23
LILFQNSLIVQATDRGVPRLSGTALVKIQVTDINDNAPVFLPSEAVEIAESKCGNLESFFFNS